MVLMGMEPPLPAIRSQIASGIDILIHLDVCGIRAERCFQLQKLQDTRKNQIILNDIYRFKEEKVQKIQCMEQWKRSVN